MDPIFKSVKHVETALELAMYMEEHCRDFYRKWAQAADTNELKSLFQFLADEEEAHYKQYRQMLTQAGREPVAKEKLLGEYGMFIDRLLAEAIRHMTLQKDMTPDMAIDAALRFEEETLLIFNEIADLFEGREKGIILSICKEEKAHITKLIDYKLKHLTSGGTAPGSD